MNRIKELRNVKGLTQVKLCSKLGIAQSTLSGWENGTSEPDHTGLSRLADFFGCSIDYILCRSDSPTVPIKHDKPYPIVSSDTITLPVIGEIAAGYNGMAVEDWTGETVEVPLSYLKGHSFTDFFVLNVTGDSMYPLYHSGDKVLILKQSAISRSGEIGAVFYGGENATLKKIEYVEGQPWMKLIPINPNYPPLTIEGEDLNNCEIIGIPKLLIREIQ